MWRCRHEHVLPSGAHARFAVGRGRDRSGRPAPLFAGPRQSSRKPTAGVLARLSAIHTGETVPYYIMRYGFKEGHTSYRANPVAIVFILGLRSIEEIEKALSDGLPELLDRLCPLH